jgi:hypothetical protein
MKFISSQQRTLVGPIRRRSKDTQRRFTRWDSPTREFTKWMCPDRIHYIKEQDGIPERDLKDALKKVFDSYAGVSKAYLVYVTYDEAPEGSVALCVLSTSREVKLVDEMQSAFKSLFRRGEHLDIMFVNSTDAARIEAVCRPFFSR